MKTLVLAVLLGAAGCSRAVKAPPTESTQEAWDRRTLALSTVAGWRDKSRLAAGALIDKYGAPDELRTTHVVWLKRYPWTKIVVRDVAPPYAGSQTTELGVVEETVVYSLRPDQAKLLEAFGSTLSWDEKKGELTARSDSEPVNFLRVNLADEVASGRLTVEQARDAYARLMALEESGKTTGYMTEVRFRRVEKPRTLRLP
jgi:hypothetical protein